MSKSLVFTGKGASLSLPGQMRQGLATIREEKALAKATESIVLLLDVSGSMSEYVGEKRKIDHLREAVRDYASLRKVSFSSDVAEGSIPNPNGGTNMADAFEHLLSSHPKEVVLISDGLPDSQEGALSAARSLACPINVIYIGPGGDEGEAFMERLAAETSGKQVTADTRLYEDFSRKLTNSVRLMLPGTQ